MIADTIPGARFILLETQHLSNVEQPETFLDAVFSFLDASGSGEPATGQAIAAATTGDPV